MTLKKTFSPEPLGQFQLILAQNILRWSGFKFLQMKNQWILIKLIIFFSSLYQPYDIIICFYWLELFSKMSDVALLFHTFSQSGFSISVLNIENSTLSYRRVSSFQIMRTTSATRNTAPETPKPIVKGLIGPGGQPKVD